MAFHEGKNLPHEDAKPGPPVMYRTIGSCVAPSGGPFHKGYFSRSVITSHSPWHQVFYWKIMLDFSFWCGPMLPFSANTCGPILTSTTCMNMF